MMQPVSHVPDRHSGPLTDSGILEIFKIPQQITPVAMIAVGYYGDINNLEPDFIAGEETARERKPLHNNFFSGDFETPYGL